MSVDLAKCNHTELLQITQRAGIDASPAMSRQELMAVLRGEMAPTPNPINTLRLGIMGFVRAHADVLRSQLTCPAKSLDPKACFECIEARPVHCFLSQDARSKTNIEGHRPPLQENTMTELAPAQITSYENFTDESVTPRWKVLLLASRELNPPPEVTSALMEKRQPECGALLWEWMEANGKLPPEATRKGAPVAKVATPKPPVEEPLAAPAVVEAPAVVAAAPTEISPVEAPAPRRGKKGAAAAAAAAAPAPAESTGPSVEGLGELNKLMASVLSELMTARTNGAIATVNNERELKALQGRIEKLEASLGGLLSTTNQILGGLRVIAEIQLGMSNGAFDEFSKSKA